MASKNQKRHERRTKERARFAQEKHEKMIRDEEEKKEEQDRRNQLISLTRKNFVAFLRDELHFKAQEHDTNSDSIVVRTSFKGFSIQFEVTGHQAIYYCYDDNDNVSLSERCQLWANTWSSSINYTNILSKERIERDFKTMCGTANIILAYIIDSLSSSQSLMFLCLLNCALL